MQVVLAERPSGDTFAAPGGEVPRGELKAEVKRLAVMVVNCSPSTITGVVDGGIWNTNTPRNREVSLRGRCLPYSGTR